MKYFKISLNVDGNCDKLQEEFERRQNMSFLSFTSTIPPQPSLAGFPKPLNLSWPLFEGFNFERRIVSHVNSYARTLDLSRTLVLSCLF